MGLLDDAIREHLDLKRQRGADPGEIERLEREALGPVRREPTGRSVGVVPHLEVNVDPEQHFEPATELLHDQGRAREPKRGFLRRNRPAPTTDPAPSDFAEHLDVGLNGPPADRFEHPDPFSQDQFDQDDPFPGADPVPQEDPVFHDEPEVKAEPPHLIFDSAPPQRPTFAPIPASEPEAEAAPADAAEHEPEAEDQPLATAGPSVAPVPAPAEPALDDHARADAARETREWSVEEAFAAEDGEQEAPAAEPAEEDVLEETPEFLQDTPDHDRLWFEQRPPRDFDFDG
jgi:hypothetical protein